LSCTAKSQSPRRRTPRYRLFRVRKLALLRRTTTTWPLGTCSVNGQVASPGLPIFLPYGVAPGRQRVAATSSPRSQSLPTGEGEQVGVTRDGHRSLASHHDLLHEEASCQRGAAWCARWPAVDLPSRRWNAIWRSSRMVHDPLRDVGQCADCAVGDDDSSAGQGERRDAGGQTDKVVDPSRHGEPRASPWALGGRPSRDLARGLGSGSRTIVWSDPTDGEAVSSMAVSPKSPTRTRGLELSEAGSTGASYR
jgi:hypothetical protein